MHPHTACPVVGNTATCGRCVRRPGRVAGTLSTARCAGVRRWHLPQSAGAVRAWPRPDRDPGGRHRHRPWHRPGTLRAWPTWRRNPPTTRSLRRSSTSLTDSPAPGTDRHTHGTTDSVDAADLSRPSRQSIAYPVISSAPLPGRGGGRPAGCWLNRSGLKRPPKPRGPMNVTPYP